MTELDASQKTAEPGSALALSWHRLRCWVTKAWSISKLGSRASCPVLHLCLDCYVMNLLTCAACYKQAYTHTHTPNESLSRIKLKYGVFCLLSASLQHRGHVMSPTETATLPNKQIILRPSHLKDVWNNISPNKSLVICWVSYLTCDRVLTHSKHNTKSALCAP